MNKYVLRGGTVADPQSPWNGQQTDILIDGTQISVIGRPDSISGFPVIEIRDSFVMPGWVDCGAFLQTPGREDRERLSEFMEAAADAGFTDVVTHVHSDPSPDTAEVITSILQASSGGPVNLHLLANITIRKEGKELSSLFEMVQAGAFGFSDGTRGIQDSGVLMRALQYSSSFRSRVFDCPVDATLTRGLHVYEGELSVRMGLKGIPVFAESARVQRDQQIHGYSGGNLIFTGISTRAALEAAGNSHTCILWLPHLWIREEEWVQFPSNRKVFPPIPPGQDVPAMVQSLVEQENVLLATAHKALSREDIDHDFIDAGTGVAAYPSCIHAIFTILNAPGIGMAKVAEIMSIRPRTRLDMPKVAVIENYTASLTIIGNGPATDFPAGYPNHGYPERGEYRIAGTVNEGVLRTTKA